MRIRDIRMVQEKGSRPLSEDVLLVCRNNTFGVFDGATGLVPYADRDGKTGGYLAAYTAQVVFLDRMGGREKGLCELAQIANWNIGEMMRRAQVDVSDPLNRWCTTVSVVRIHEGAFKWMGIGDSNIIVIRRDGSFEKLPNDPCDTGILELWKKLVRQGVRNVAVHPELDAKVRAVRREANVSYGFLNGDSRAMSFVKYGVVPLEGVAHILIFSDGFELPQEDPQIDGTAQLVNHFRAGGLKQVLNLIRAMERSDPECVRFPRYKPHDDASAIAVSF